MHHAEIQRRAGRKVSILVVLDWTMMLAFCPTAGCSVRRFNPCCIGLDNDACAKLPDPAPLIERFNPCCIGLDNDACGESIASKASLVFQSLLYWIGQ